MSKQIESEEGAPGEQGRPLGVRAAAKARTRQRLIAAAKQLFMERGYEGATVRDIAAAAGLSTGAVFASFADKVELFNEVLLFDGEAQYELMARAAEEPGRVHERLVRVLSAAYGYQLAQLELLRAAIAVSWSQGLAGELGDRPIRKAATEIVRAVLEQGLSDGELAAGGDLEIVTETIWDCFVGNFRHAMFGDMGEAQLTDRLRRQLDLIVAA
jgi:AcrR family transcriptional regulator